MQDQDTSARFSRSMPYYSEAQHVFARALTDYRGDLSKLDLVLYSIRRSSQGPESGPEETFSGLDYGSEFSASLKF